MVGRVADVAAYYSGSAVCIIPLLAGSGFKTKLIEALGYGKACVSTPIGAAGIDHLQEPPLIIEGEESKFAAAVISLLESDTLRRNYEQRAADYIRKFHSTNVIYGPILEYLKKTIGPTGDTSVAVRCLKAAGRD